MGEADILAELQLASERDDAWGDLAPLFHDETTGVHLAVMVEPYLTFLLNGEKVIESRFSKNAITPFGRVNVGDLVFLKAGPVLGSFRVASTQFITLFDGELMRLRRRYAEQICAYTDDFWEARADKRYATLMGVEAARHLSPVSVPKRDMRGWVVLREGTSNQAPRQLRLV